MILEKLDHYSAEYVNLKQISIPQMLKADKTWNCLDNLTKIQISGKRWLRAYKKKLRVKGQ